MVSNAQEKKSGSARLRMLCSRKKFPVSRSRYNVLPRRCLGNSAIVTIARERIVRYVCRRKRLLSPTALPYGIADLGVVLDQQPLESSRDSRRRVHECALVI